MTGEQKPGGLEVVAWLYNTVSGEGKALVKPLQYLDGEQVLGVALTPAEPAEARIKSLEHRLETARFARVEHNRQFEAEREARLAAEAKLARAVEFVRKLDCECDPSWAWGQCERCKTLAALQQEGE